MPMDSSGRIYAVYGGFFIVMSFLLGWALDGDQPDLGDVVGGVIAMAGGCAGCHALAKGLKSSMFVKFLKIVVFLVQY